MNKYSKRALKTTATVGMSLAMVLSGVAAPIVKVDAVNYCTNDVNLAYLEVIATLEDAGLEIDTMKLTDLVDDKGTGETSDDVDVEAYLTTKSKAISDFAACNKPEDETATKLKDFVAKTKALQTNIETLQGYLGVIGELGATDGTELDANGTWYDADGELKSADKVITEAKPIYEKLTSEDTEAYLANISDLHTDAYNAHFAELEAIMGEYKDDNFGTVVEEYIEELKKVVLYTGTTVKDFIDAKGVVVYTNLSKFEASVEKIKEDKISALKSIANYSEVEAEDDVLDIMEELDAAIDGMTEVKDIVSTRNPSTVAYNKIKSKSAVTSLLTISDFAEFDTLVGAVTTEQLEVLADYYNDVTSMFYELTVKERANGTYTATLTKTDLVNYITVTAATAYEGVFDDLAKLVDNKEEGTYLELVLGQADIVTKALKAITTDIKGITVKNLNSANAAKVVAAKEALDTLLEIKDSGLTKAQKKTVETAKNNIDILYTYMLYNGIVAETNNGWVDLGNGNWDYYQDGKAATKWVAAGSNWYFVQNGHMLRNSWVAQDSTGAKWYYVDNAGKMVSNTTIDGFVIDANGVWTR